MSSFRELRTDVLEEVAESHEGHLTATQKARIANARQITLSHLSVLKPYIELRSERDRDSTLATQKLATRILAEASRLQSTVDEIDTQVGGALQPSWAEHVIASLEASMAFFQGTLVHAVETDLHTQVGRASVFAEIIRVLLVLLLLFGVTVTHLFIELRRKKQSLSEFATTDPLTGLVNRRSGLELAGSLISLAARTDAPVSVAIVDLGTDAKATSSRASAARNSLLRCPMPQRRKHGWYASG